MPARVVVVGGGAAGIGAAGAARQVDPNATVTVFTEYEDVAYSPCGIPYVHGKEIPTFEQLFLAELQGPIPAFAPGAMRPANRSNRSWTANRALAFGDP